MAYLPIRAGHPHQFRGVEGRLIEFDGISRPAYAELGCHGVVAVWNRFNFGGHGFLPFGRQAGPPSHTHQRQRRVCFDVAVQELQGLVPVHHA